MVFAMKRMMREKRNRGWRLAALCAALGVACAAASARPAASAAAAQQVDKKKPGLYMTFQTDKGDIVCKLDEADAPVTVRTMVGLAIGKMSYVDPQTQQTTRNKFFDGMAFYRVAPNVLIQAGDPHQNGTVHPEGPGFPYKNEIVASLKFDKPGQLGMANSGADKNDSHFFITAAPYPAFNGRFTIWGQCGNAEVVKAISMVPKDEGDTPLAPVHIQHVVVERVGPAPADAPEAMPPSGAPN